MSKALERIIKFSIYSLVFLVPLFLLPFSFEIYEFSKQYLIFFLVSIGFIAWLSKMIFIDKEIRLRKTPLNILVFVFLLISIISTYFSVDKNSSLFGFYGRFSNGLISLICLGLFYFLMINNVGSKEQETENQEQMNTASSLINSNTLVNLFLWSVFFVVLIAYFSVFGLWQKIPVSFLPSFFMQKTFNPASGSLEGLSMFLSVVIVLLTTKIVVGSIKEKSKNNKVLLVFLIAIIALMMIIDFNASWLVLMISLILFLIFALITRIFKEDVNRLLLPIILIFISITFLFVNNFNQLTGISLPKEQVLEQMISWQTSLKTITNSFKNAFLGSGIGTWHYDFSKFKPVKFNNTIWWQIRFDRAGNYASELLATLGILGFISYFFIVIMFFWVFWVLREKKEIFPYVTTFIALIITQFIYYQNTILAFSFWFILALSVVSWQHRDKSVKVISLKDLPELNLIFSTILILVLLAVSISYYFAVKFYLADINYAKAQTVFIIEDKIELLEKAISLNPKLFTYQTFSARIYLFSFLNELKKPADQQDAEKIQRFMISAIDYGKKATELSPNTVAVWETLGMIYRDIQIYVDGAADWAIMSFKEAVNLESKNPILYTEIGKLYLISKDENIEKAKESFAQAKELKPDYLDALIQEVLIYEREGNLDAAIKEAEKLVKAYPFNVEAQFHLGRLYFNKGESDRAIAQFEAILSIVPNHSNSLYSLGVAYAAKGEKQKAISVFEKVLELNPANQDIVQKLKELREE
ncbi:MAG: tetratricopeptide repeat protein [Candidatus Nealsonbacteria bacterium]